MANVRVGIDLGGTKIEAVALDPRGEARLRRRVPTPRGDYAATIAAIVSLVDAMEREVGSRVTVGVGFPGALSPATGLVKNANSTWLIGTPFAQDLRAALSREVRFQNDANCFALSEARDGAGEGARVVFGVIVGTGTGGGIVVDGKLLGGPNAIAGEWGHNPLPWPRVEERAESAERTGGATNAEGATTDDAANEWPGPPCYCGRTGCIETFLSGPGLARDFERATGEAVDPSALAARAAAGDRAAEDCLCRYEDRMARALASVINLLDPDVIVFGGGLSNVDRLYTNVPARWAPFVFSDTVRTRLVKARHGDSSGVRGAAWLWP
jgi:fructokinase